LNTVSPPGRLLPTKTVALMITGVGVGIGVGVGDGVGVGGGTIGVGVGTGVGVGVGVGIGVGEGMGVGVGVATCIKVVLATPPQPMAASRISASKTREHLPTAFLYIAYPYLFVCKANEVTGCK
jgi:hypothetical protein